MAKTKNKKLIWAVYGEVEQILLLYKLCKITLDEAKKYLQQLTK